MRIGLVADTHIPQAASELPPDLIRALLGVDLILHAGDIYTTSVLDELEKVAPVLAARGDDDWGSTLTDRRVKEKHVLSLEGRTLWLIHQRPYYLTPQWWRSRQSSETGQPDPPDVVIFGHEHRTVVERVNDVLLVSPGSPTFLNYLRGLGTIGILHLNSGEVDVSIVHL